jgi:hypothetical protein
MNCLNIKVFFLFSFIIICSHYEVKGNKIKLFYPKLFLQGGRRKFLVKIIFNLYKYSTNLKLPILINLLIPKLIVTHQLTFFELNFYIVKQQDH